MKLCPTCKKNYPDDANFCPEESCATPDGPQRLVAAGNGAAAAGPGGRFQLLAKLGGGTTGEVWRARDSQTGAEVAYKVVAADVLPNAGAVARADRELKQLMRVASPRLATIVDCGTTPDGRLYVATELLEGAESLDKHLRRGPVPLDRAKAVVAQIGHALLEAQKAGLVHRDLAPKNVLVLPSGDVKVLNFPIAKPVTDRVAGVPAYLSPEQAQGKTADQRSNTYSLACILYHLLTGEPPFAASDPQALLELHVSSPPLAPSQRRPAANLPTDVDKVILKALDKSSSRRQLTLRLFLSEVESVSAAPAAGAPGAPVRDAGFAKTMLFAGGQAEVQKMVANAIAARNAGGKPAPAAAPAAAPAPSSQVSFANPAPTPAPAAQAGYAPTPLPDPPLPPVAAGAPASAAIAQTVAAAAASSVSPSSPASRLTPPPVTPAPAGGEPGRVASAPLETHAVSNTPPKEPAGHAPAPSAEAGGKGPVKSGAAFRETLWFKKGDVDQMVAEAKAKMAAAGANPAAAPTPEVAGDDVRPIEDRYVDDGSVTAEDRKKFSLRTGGTATSLPVVAKEIPGEKMSEADLVEELGGGKKKMVLVAAAAVVVAAIVAVVMMMSGGKSETPKPAAAAPAPAAPVAAAPPPAPDPATPAAAPAAAAPAAPAPTAAVAVGKDEKAADAAPSRKRAARTAAKKPVDKKRARR